MLLVRNISELIDMRKYVRQKRLFGLLMDMQNVLMKLRYHEMIK